MDTKSLPGWATRIDEISNGIFKVTLTNNFGRKVKVTNNTTDKTIDKALSYAFDIEKKISANWNKFLFDFCLLRLVDIIITGKSYSDNNFGSWFIEVGNKRLLYLNKEFCLVSQTQSDDKWFDNCIIKDNKLTYNTTTNTGYTPHYE